MIEYEDPFVVVNILDNDPPVIFEFPEIEDTGSIALANNGIVSQDCKPLSYTKSFGEDWIVQ